MLDKRYSIELIEGDFITLLPLDSYDPLTVLRPHFACEPVCFDVVFEAGGFYYKDEELTTALKQENFDLAQKLNLQNEQS